MVSDDPAVSGHDAIGDAGRGSAILFTLAALQFIAIVDFMIVMPLGPTDRGLDFQGDRVREGFKGRVADRNGIGPLASPNSHDSLTGLRREKPINADIPKEF